MTVDWFKRVTKEENWPSLQDFLPWDLISCRESTKQRLAKYYDDYYDSFTVDANEENLLRSFKRIEAMVSYRNYILSYYHIRYTTTLYEIVLGNSA